MHPSRRRLALQADDSLSIVSGKPKRRKILRDEQGEYRFEIFFVNGKQKRMKVRLIDGSRSVSSWRGTQTTSFSFIPVSMRSCTSEKCDG